MFETYATKLGIHSSTVIRRAKEHQQKLEIRGSVSTLNVPSSCQHVICLELAASNASVSVDRIIAIKLSGVNKRTYVSTYKAVETILGLTEIHTIRELTVQFGCTPMQSLAETILDRYEEDHRHESESGVDFSSTMFKCAAICVACKKNKVKIERTKLYEMSAMKRNAFENLTTEMERLADKIICASKSNVTKSKKSNDTLMDRVYANMEQENNSSAANVQSETTAQLDFDEWKRKILSQAT